MSLYTFPSTPTMFDGVLYRSANEANWARVFAGEGIEYTYEPITTRLQDYGVYTPDFRLAAKDGDLFIEIKPKKSFVDQQAWTKAWQFCIQTGNQIAIVTGRPFINNKKARLVHPKRGSEMKKFDVLIWGDRP
mgnify:CR=1 FL=1